jgi:hypothetical protein
MRKALILIRWYTVFQGRGFDPGISARLTGVRGGGTFAP